jgi:hypothetical protein
MKSREYRNLPLVYSCSGCSSAAQAANYIALKLDREGEAEMSCISGVGGNVQHLVNIARSGRPILALDGCPLACTLHCLNVAWLRTIICSCSSTASKNVTTPISTGSRRIRSHPGSYSRRAACAATPPHPDMDSNDRLYWNMKYPAFIDDVPKIRLYDPLAEFLGALDDGIIEYSYLDAVKLAGHSCPTVASAYWMTCKALKALYGEDVPERGNIQIEFRQASTDGVCGVIANVAGFLTGAGTKAAFKGIGGRFDRRNRLLFESAIPGEIRFTRLDTGQAVNVSVNLKAVPSAPHVSELLPACLNGTASPDERAEFSRAWQARVKAVLLDHADDTHVFKISKE